MTPPDPVWCAGAELSLPIWCYVWFLISLRPGVYDLDHGGLVGSFTIILERYHRLFVCIGVLDLLGFIWLTEHGAYIGALAAVISLCYGVCLLATLIGAYESYLNVRYPRNPAESRSDYTTAKRAMILAFGWASFLLFLFAAGDVLVQVAKGAK